MIKVDVQKRLADFALDAKFDVPAGITALFGPSGSGKTTLINMVAGLQKPDAGRISVGDAVLFDARQRLNPAPHARKIGYVFQDARLFPHMSVLRNLRYGGTHDEARLIEVLGLGNLLDRMPAALSGGEGQRVALGRALMCDPQLNAG